MTTKGNGSSTSAAIPRGWVIIGLAGASWALVEGAVLGIAGLAGMLVH